MLDIVTLGVLTHGHWIWMVVFLGVCRVLIDYCIAPRVFGRELEIHPLLAIFTLMVGAAVGGFAGVYLAVPCSSDSSYLEEAGQFARRKRPAVSRDRRSRADRSV